MYIYYNATIMQYQNIIKYYYFYKFNTLDLIILEVYIIINIIYIILVNICILFMLYLNLEPSCVS